MWQSSKIRLWKHCHSLNLVWLCMKTSIFLIISKCCHLYWKSLCFSVLLFMISWSIFDQPRPVKFTICFCRYFRLVQCLHEGPPWLALKKKFVNFRPPDPRKMVFQPFVSSSQTQCNVMNLWNKPTK